MCFFPLGLAVLLTLGVVSGVYVQVSELTSQDTNTNSTGAHTDYHDTDKQTDRHIYKIGSG